MTPSDYPLGGSRESQFKASLLIAIKNSPTSAGNIIRARKRECADIEILKGIKAGLEKNISFLDQRGHEPSLKKSEALAFLLEKMQAYLRIIEGKTLISVAEGNNQEEISPDQRLDNYIKVLRGGQIS